MGKPPDETLGAEVLPLADACRFLERHAARLLRPRAVPLRDRPLWLFGQRDTVYRRPHGLVGVIGTWNYPLILNGVQIVQALTAGNAVLWKPSEVVPATAAALLDLLHRAGYPPDLMQALEATREAGEELASADIDHVVFTGSAAVGRALAANLGRRLVSSTMELSGCDALFVLDDADVPLAARAAWFGCNLNRGQTCLAVRRVFVQRPAYEPFVRALEPLAATAVAVPLVLASAAEQAKRLVSAAVTEGGRLLEAKPAAPANGSATAFVPSVVVNARPEMALCREGSFAPVMAVLPFDTLDDALGMNAACSFGLGASVFTGRPERAADLAARLRTGLVAVNDTIAPTAHPATPFGGRGTSGWGVTQGAEGLLELTVPQAVSVRGGRFRPHYDMVRDPAPPQGELLRGFLEWGHGRSFGERCRGLWRLVRELWRLT
jgi:acyl-CoA reductase-like NAD-dependent aldehyde dehydrogenase